MTNDVTNLTQFPVPSSDLRVLERNANDVDKLINQSGTIQNRSGDTLRTFQQIAAEIGTITNRGPWASGVSYSINDIWRHRTTNVYYQVLQAYTSGVDEAADIALTNPKRVEVYQSLLSAFPNGTSRPSVVVQYGVWVDTTTATAWDLKFYDGSDDITFATFNPSTNAVSFPGVIPSVASATAGHIPELNAQGNLESTGISKGYVPRFADASGTVDAITADLSPDATLEDGSVLIITATGANTSAAPTLSVDGGTARTIVKQGNQALVAGDIPRSGYFIFLVYDLGNTRWEIINPATSPGLAIGQTWQDVTSSRSVGVTYTNTTGQPIQLGIFAQTANSHSIQFLINGTQVAGSSASSTGMSHNFNHIIPNGSNYSIGTFSGQVTLNWWELR